MQPVDSSGPAAPVADASRVLPWILFLIFFAVLNETVFNVSTPMIAEQFSLSAGGVSWMMTIFMITFGIGGTLFGKLGDLFRLKDLIVWGVALYCLGSVLGLVFRNHYPSVVAARAIQGLGASAIPSLVFVIAARFFPEDKRGSVFGWITSVVSLSVGIGPVIGGLVSKHLHWSLLFVLPLGTLLALPFLRRHLPAEETKKGSLDLLGAFLLAACVGLLVLTVSRPSGIAFAAFVLSLVLLLLRLFLSREPFLEPRLFANGPFRLGVVVGFTTFALVLGLLFAVPLMLHEVFRLGTDRIGWILFPGAISAIFVGPLAGRWADAKGNLFVVTVGLLLLVASLAVMAVIGAWSALVIAGALLLTYVGFSFFQTAIVNGISQSLPEKDVGVGMGLFNLLATIAGAIGGALVGRCIEAGWLRRDLLGLPGDATSSAYSNLFLVFGAVILVALFFYRMGMPGRKKSPVSGT